MNYKPAFILVFWTFLLLTGCEADEEDKYPPVVEGTFIDHGFIPADVEIRSYITPFQSAIFHNGKVFVATSDGLWKNDLTTKEWSRAGFQGMEITLIYKHPYFEDVLFAGIRSSGDNTVKTLHISEDGGLTWQAVENPLPLVGGGFENYTCLAVRPGHPQQIFANMEGGAMIAISLDGGMNWERMNYQEEQYLGYTSTIAFLPEDPNHIFQGSENPMDIAWLARYEINDSDPVMLENYTVIVGLKEWGNRRPNEMKTYSFEPHSLYIGQEGALSKLTGESLEYIYRAKDGDENFPYSYIYAIWVNPENPKHLIFGGSVNYSEQLMSLYETSRDGNAVHRFEDKLGFDNPEVIEIVHTDTYPAIIINEMGKKRVKLFLYDFD